MKLLTTAEAKTLYGYLKSSIDPKDVFLQILFETGARVSESLTLSATHLVGYSLGIDPLKGSGPRKVTVSPNLAAKLAHLPADRWARSLSPAGGTPPTNASLKRGLCRHFHALSQRLLHRRVNLHTLRHTAFMRLYLATKDLLLVKQWAGHRSIGSTMAYMHEDRGAMADATANSLLKALDG